MKTRTKCFLGVLAGAAMIAAASSPGNGSGVVMLAVVFALLWAAWRVFIFLSVLLRPVRDKLQPLNSHVDASLRKSGMNSLADVGKKFQSGVDGAVDATLKGIEERK